MNAIKQYTLLIVAAAVCVVAIALPAIVYMRTSDAKAAVAEIEAQVGSSSARADAERATRQLLADTAAMRDRLPSFVVANGGAADLIKDIESDGARAGVDLDIGGVDVAPQNGAFDLLSLSVRATGTFDALMRLMMLIENMPYASTITAVAFERGERSGWTMTLSVAVLIAKQ